MKITPEEAAELVRREGPDGPQKKSADEFLKSLEGAPKKPKDHDPLTAATVLVRLRGQCFQLDRSEAERLHDDLGAILGRTTPAYIPYFPAWPYPMPRDDGTPQMPPWPIITCGQIGGPPVPLGVAGPDSVPVGSQTVCRSEDGVTP